ncbi:hypothetical protein NKJ50_09750 [Mesorhizobium sp. M0115]|uniref:hypothetical protein n=1 Tax=Mesorhizobium sp. M0115 TaxID=2956883 RepID=UPI0033390538
MQGILFLRCSFLIIGCIFVSDSAFAYQTSFRGISLHQSAIEFKKNMPTKFNLKHTALDTYLIDDGDFNCGTLTVDTDLAITSMDLSYCFFELDPSISLEDFTQLIVNNYNIGSMKGVVEHNPFTQQDELSYQAETSSGEALRIYKNLGMLLTPSIEIKDVKDAAKGKF